MMAANVGDHIIVESEKVGRPAREGVILEVVETALGTSFRVLWNDQHESTFRPTGGSARIIPERKPETQHA